MNSPTTGPMLAYWTSSPVTNPSMQNPDGSPSLAMGNPARRFMMTLKYTVGLP